LIFTIALLTSNNSYGQVIHKTLVAMIDGVEYPNDIGKIYGTYSYHLIYKLNKAGFIESMHWNAFGSNLYDENGNNVKVIDSGHDNSGTFWDFWNNPAVWNEGWAIEYNVEDGWLNGVMPTQMLIEGVCINMSAKILVKGKMYRMGLMIVFHLNANLDPVVDFVKINY
jgi:hypothetical protein